MIVSQVKFCNQVQCHLSTSATQSLQQLITKQIFPSIVYSVHTLEDKWVSVLGKSM